MSAPYWSDDAVELHHGDCLAVLRDLPDASVDAIVTDPPYGLEFMGKEWDAPWKASEVTRAQGRDAAGRTGSGRGASPTQDRPRFGLSPTALVGFQMWCEAWSVECLRVLKPGGHLLASGGTRTWHRLACAVEDAGFEIRDSIAWLYGSGFAKSWNFRTQYSGEWCSCNGRNALPLDHAGNPEMRGLRDLVHPSPLTRSEGEGTHLFSSVQRSEPGTGLGAARVEGPRSVVAGSGSLGAGEDDGAPEPRVGRRVVPGRQGVSPGADAGAPERAAERVRPGTRAGDDEGPWSSVGATGGGAPHQSGAGRQPAGESAAVPGSPVALDDGALRDGPVCSRCGGLDQAYRGFGTGLKPSFEPIVVARKPLIGTVAANVLAHGTGALNIDGCRVEGAFISGWSSAPGTKSVGGIMNVTDQPRDATPDNPAGRWPTNVILDDTQAAELDRQSGVLAYNPPATWRTSGAGTTGDATYGAGVGAREAGTERSGFDDKGGASRFFPTFRYEAKAPTSERPRHGETAHPTVKPVDLMRWLVRLVTPPGGTVLDPFAGSGTTAEACVVEGFRCVLIEREADYLPLIVARLSKPIAPVLDFGASA